MIFLLNRKRELSMNRYVETTNLKGIFNSTHLTSINVAKKFDDLIIEVLKVMDNAQKEIYFATRYHDQHVSSRVFEKLVKVLQSTYLMVTPNRLVWKTGLLL
jgi:hypothetical protein